MEGTFKIVRTEYDVLQERYTVMELGTLSTTLAEALGINQEASNRLTTSDVDDYVVDYGVSGKWTYRKWNSGVAECWAHTTSGAFAPTGTTSGGISYRTLSATFPQGLFNVAPSAHCDCKWGTGVSWASARTLSITTLEYVVAKINNSSEGADFYFYAVGTWK